ncbi:MAG: SUMF1/EgtB/PvdO family nonheme iron enzyme [Bryobacteraceae bacterium]
MRPNPELAQALSEARVQTDRLFEVVRANALYERPIPERHRIIFYIGHLEAFDWNLFGRAVDLPKSNPEFDQLFSFGIDPGSDDLPTDQPSDWPHIDEVRKYNANVREALDAILLEVPEQYLHVAIEHRLMHAETFAYMLHNLAFEHKVPQPEAAAHSGPPQQTGTVEIKGGTAILGRKRGNGFGWDNEFDQVRCVVPAFTIGSHKVTNRDYLEFVRQGAAAPHFWMCRNGDWFYRGMFQDIPLPLDWPVYVSQLEAREYAAWKGKSLPSEAQFQRAAYGNGPTDLAGENVDFRHWDPVPVTSGTPNGFGVSQMVGNGWEWTATKFAPFPGFEPFPFYPGYSANFFDGEHYVLKGGSPRTAACMLRPSFRNWFRPTYPYVYATFRLVEN